ncbi:MAG: hypothetical protein PHI98_14225 [Eubacteriales bacterium]|nr:hypothetical protein [Eubacteriales bacterium]
MDWNKLFSRLSVPGLTLLVVGMIGCFQATKLCRLVFRERGERWIMPMKLVGLALAVLGALILLDVIPGL